jgi:hypothetical protein
MPAPSQHDGRLSPHSDPVTGAPGWLAITPSRRLAAAVARAVPGGTVHAHQDGEWQVRIPHPVLIVTVTGADAGTAWCRLGGEPQHGVFTLALAPWPAATVLRCPLTALPAQGHLSVRDVRVITRMGRTVRYLIPVFTPR